VAVVQDGRAGSENLSLHLVNAGTKPGLAGLAGRAHPVAIAS
jgi:hypothetical protein